SLYTTSSSSPMFHSSLFIFVFFFFLSADHRDLHSFPTRRSSDLESRLPVGSSASRIEGSFTSARAIATRWRCPPDSSFGRCVIRDRKSTRLNSSHVEISYAVFCLKKKKKTEKPAVKSTIKSTATM